MQVGDYLVGRDGKLRILRRQEHGPDGPRDLALHELWLGTVTKVATDDEGRVDWEWCEVRPQPGVAPAAESVPLASFFAQDWRFEDA